MWRTSYTILKDAKQKHGSAAALRLAVSLPFQSPEFRQSLSRRVMKAASAPLVLISAVLSVCWGIAVYEFLDGSPPTDIFRYGSVVIPFDLFFHWGWVFPVSLFLWAIRASDELHRGHRKRQIAAAGATSGALGHAGFASTDDLLQAELIGPKSKFGTGIRLGFEKKSGEVIRYRGEAHGLLVAPARSGKFRDMLCAMLLEWKHSAVIIDPKGQICAVTKKQREKLGRVFVLNPFNILPDELGPSNTYNPMAALDPQSDEFDAECATIADAIVVHEGGGEKHWSDSARLLITGMMMHLVSQPFPEDERNLGNLRNIITGPDLITFANSAMASGDEFTKQKLARFAEAAVAENKGELQSIISNADTQTGFITKAIARNLAASSFRFRDLKRSRITVYVVLPTRMFAVAGKWFRLIVASALNELMREERGLPVLAVWDEFAQLGHLKAMRNAMGQSAGMGLQMIPVLQDLNQLKADYQDGWETFLANADFRQFYAANDVFTQEYVSKLSGVTTINTRSSSFGDGPGGGSSNTTFGEQQRPVLYPHEVGRIGADEFLMFARGVKNMIHGRRAPYFDTKACPELQGLYRPDPYHQPRT